MSARASEAKTTSLTRLQPRGRRLSARAGKQVVAALSDLRLGGRRQVDADRPAALRHQADLRRSTGGAGEGLAASTARPARISISRCWWTGWRPSASRALRSTSPIASSPPSKRKFIVADTPGHEQYTRNMATGASTADLAIVLIDARKGVLRQTRRHSYHRLAARHPACGAGGQQD